MIKAMKKVMIEIINEIDDEKNGEYFNDLIKKAINTTLICENITEQVEVSVSIVDEVKIQTLNRDFRNIDKITDVLSFPLIEFDLEDDKNGVIRRNRLIDEVGGVPLGDIVICLDVAKRQAYEYGHSLEREVAFLTVHSMLHLLGYDHIEEDDEMVMRGRQREIMGEMDI